MVIKKLISRMLSVLLIVIFIATGILSVQSAAAHSIPQAKISELENNKIGYFQTILPELEALTLTSTSPNTKTAGDADFNIVLNGTGFDMTSVALWNDIELITSFVSSTQLTALIPSYDINVEGVAEITVRNGPTGSMVTSPVMFVIQPRANTWMTHSPEGGIIWDVAVDPANPNIVYAATSNAGAYKSINGGQSWLAINNGLSTSSLAAIAVNPTNPSILLAGSAASGDGVFLSTNGGAFWIRVLISANVHAIEFDPQNSNIAYVATGCGLLKTINGGTTWQEISGNKLPLTTYCQEATGNSDILSLAIDPQHEGTLYAIVNQEGTVWKTTDSGTTWQNVSNGLPGTMLRSIAIDPSNPNILYAGTVYKAGMPMGLYKSADGGQSWAQVINNENYYFDIDISKADPNIIYVISGPQQGIYRSTDSGITWQFIPSSADLMNIDTDPNDFTTLYGVGYHGIFKSTNSGVYWETINKGLYAQSITSLLYVPQNNNSIFASTVYGGNWKSTDFGASWQKWGNYKGDTFNELNFSKIVADPNNSMNMYANNYKSNDGGQIWEWFTPNIFSESPVAAITVAANSDIYNGVNISWGESRIIKSSDGGNTWNNKSNGIPARSIQFMEADPFDPNIIYAYFSDWYDGRDGGLLYKSIDTGENWGLIYSGVVPNGWGTGVNALAIDPSNTNNLYLATTTGVFKSLDGGATWNSVSTGLSGIVVNAIAVDPGNNQILYIGTEGNGAYKSVNAGLSWESLNYGLNSLTIRAVLPIPDTPSTALPLNVATSFAAAEPSQSEQSQRLFTIAGGTIYSYYIVEKTVPFISTITRASTSPTSATSVNFILTFSEPVAGVDANGSDFTLTASSGLPSAVITEVTPVSDSVYSVSVNTGSGSGTLRLDVPVSASIQDMSNNALSGLPFTSGEVYTKVVSAMYKSNSTYDGWILESSETSNTGGTLNSAQTTFILGDDATDKQYRAILHFDTSALPDTAVVTNMTLKIKQQGSFTGTSPFTFASLYVDMRNPAFGTSALELTDFNFAAKKVKPAVFNPNPVSGWFSARFNNGGNLYVNRTGTTQLRLYFSVDDNDNNIADFIRFFSGNASAGDRPKLLIQYYAP